MSGNRNIRNDHGFTIVELLIATVVFSMVLVVITAGVLQFTHDYYQGVNTTNTQNIARNVSDTITQAIQFSGSAPSPADTSRNLSGVFCAGNVEYAYNLGQEVQRDGSVKGLVQYPVTGGPCDPTSIPSSGGTELLENRMRLLEFAVTNSPTGSGIWNVTIKVGLGDDDQFCAPEVSSGTSCNAGNTLSSSDFTSPDTLKDMVCKPQAGSQFCDVSTLATTAQSRLQQVN